jgi:hypothetical protein
MLTEYCSNVNVVVIPASNVAVPADVVDFSKIILRYNMYTPGSVNAIKCLFLFTLPDFEYIHTYISLTPYPRRGSRGISDIPPRHPRFTKIS